MDCDIASYHVESYNYLIEEGLRLAAHDVPKEKFRLPNGDAIEFGYVGVNLGYPILDLPGTTSNKNVRVYPAECRQRGLTYRAPLKASISISINGRTMDLVDSIIGDLPIMVRSKRCHLANLSEEELVRFGEEPLEKGGYFICKGMEKVMRLLVANKRNFPIALERKSMRNKGKLFSQYAILMRCIRENLSASIITMHYLESANLTLAIQFRRELFYVPLMYILKALTDFNDSVIYNHLIRARPNDTFWAGCVTNMLANALEEGIINRKTALIALGSRFRIALGDRVAPWETDEEAARYLLNYCVCIHLKQDVDKFFCLTYMAQKLMALVKGEILSESPDNPQFQEASVSGHIILLMLRERLENVLISVRKKLEIIAKRKGDSFNFTSSEFTKALTSMRGGEISRGLEYFLATGNLITRNGLGLMQTTGFAVVAERINQLRFVSHFRAIHRGSFFTEMRTTDVRKLRPEAWGFICPVHTPDGSPCGLLNHVTASCRIVTHYSETKKLNRVLAEYGVIFHATIDLFGNEDLYPVFVDGNFVGYIPIAKAAMAERHLRVLKVGPTKAIPSDTEIVLIRHSSDPANVLTQFPGLYLFTDPGRLIRPVKNLAFDQIEWIGMFEQVYLSIIIDPNEYDPGVTIHQELHPSCLFSFAGNLIPFPDHNQSPRNVYQCQMGKQTMGVPVHAWCTRADQKMYRLQFPQSPLVQLEAHKKYGMDDYPLGTNACVAVISYTGYDMEDAMVINKSSYQRGFAHGTVIKVERIDLMEKSGFLTKTDFVILANPNKHCPSIGSDGLPIIGRLYQLDEPYYSLYNTVTGEFTIKKFHYAEPAVCGMVRILHESDKYGKVHALIQWRITRNPIIGDKFASRHGQKGINSFLWPAESLPFSESGMVPDIIFNPHGFPSRMTIGMMIESMAGKAAAMHCDVYDASPFVFNEKKTAIDHFGQLLTAAGYNYYGNEVMYSGVDGREMEVEIFFGVVYYQRLRHMVADKFQVRATGPVDPVTLQPVKGRKKGGGIRFGEMERDALIAHGSAFCLQVVVSIIVLIESVGLLDHHLLELAPCRFNLLVDRLFNCSDRDSAYICRRCGSLLSATRLRPELIKMNEKRISIKSREVCLQCGESDEIFLVQVPRVFRYLAAELSAMSIKIKLSIEKPGDINRS